MPAIDTTCCTPASHRGSQSSTNLYSNSTCSARLHPLALGHCSSGGSPGWRLCAVSRCACIERAPNSVHLQERAAGRAQSGAMACAGSLRGSAAPPSRSTVLGARERRGGQGQETRAAGRRASGRPRSGAGRQLTMPMASQPPMRTRTAPSHTRAPPRCAPSQPKKALRRSVGNVGGAGRGGLLHPRMRLWAGPAQLRAARRCLPQPSMPGAHGGTTAKRGTERLTGPRW